MNSPLWRKRFREVSDMLDKYCWQELLEGFHFWAIEFRIRRFQTHLKNCLDPRQFVTGQKVDIGRHCSRVSSSPTGFLERSGKRANFEDVRRFVAIAKPSPLYVRKDLPNESILN